MHFIYEHRGPKQQGLANIEQHLKQLEDTVALKTQEIAKVEVGIGAVTAQMNEMEEIRAKLGQALLPENDAAEREQLAKE